MTYKDRLQVIRQTRIRMAILNEKRDSLFDRMCYKLGIDPNSNSTNGLFDYIYNGDKRPLTQIYPNPRPATRKSPKPPAQSL